MAKLKKYVTYVDPEHCTNCCMNGECQCKECSTDETCDCGMKPS